MIRAPAILLLLFGLLLPLTAGCAGLYKWVDEHGRVHFSDTPPAQGGAEQVELGKLNTYSTPSEILNAPKNFRGGGASAGRGKGKVIMYSTTWCGVCKKAKAFFRRQRIPFTEYDVEKSQRGKREFKRLGGRGVPVILVGDKRINGFSEGRMRKMLREAGYGLRDS